MQGKQLIEVLNHYSQEGRLLEQLKTRLEKIVGPIEFEDDPITGLCYALPAESGYFGQGESQMDALKSLEQNLKENV